MTHPEAVLDPWAEAENAKPPTYTHFGQITAVSDYVIWPKGTQFRDCPPFDAKQHKPEQRVVRVTLLATPLPGRSNPFPHERIIPIYSREWTAVTLPSLKALNVSARELDGKWAQYQFKKARTYTDSNGNQKDSTSFDFVEFYDTEDAAADAAEEFFGQLQTASEIADEIPGFETADDGNGKATDPQRAAMAQFLPAIWAQCGGDVTEMAKKIAGMPMLAEHFDIKSQEVIEVIGG